MRKLIIFIFLCWIPAMGMSIGLEEVLEAVIQVESRGNPRAKSGQHLGILQISPITVRECNRLLGKKAYTYNDRLSPEKSKEMWWIIQGHYNPSNNIEHAIRLWNGGPGYSVKGTERYYRKVLKTLQLKNKVQR